MEARLDCDSVEMKQDDASGNTDGGQDGAMLATAPKEKKNTGEKIDAQGVVSASRESVSGSTNTREGEDHAAGPAVDVSTADGTSPELTTSGSSLGGANSSSPPVTEITDGKAEYEMERSIISCNDSPSGISNHSGVIDKSGRNCENNDIDDSHLHREAVLNLETPDESLSESNPRDSLSSTSVTSTPGVSDSSGRNSGSSDMDHSPSKPTLEDTALQNTNSEQRSENKKMMLRSGKVTHAESVIPKKLRDTSKLKNKSAGRPTKRRCSDTEQSHSSSEENPEKLLRLESSDTLTSGHDTEYSTGFVNNPSGDITNVPSLISGTNTTMAVVEDSPSEEELLLLLDADDSPLHEASDATAAEQEEAMMGNEKSEDEKRYIDNSEVAPDNGLNSVVKEERLDQASTISESSAYQTTENAMETDSLPCITIDESFSFYVKLEVPEKTAFNGPSASVSDVSTEAQPCDPQSPMSRDSALSSDEKEFASNNSIKITTNMLVEEPCVDFEECFEEAVNNAPQDNSPDAINVEISSGSRQISLDVRDGGSGAHSFFVITGRGDSDEHFERNVTLDAEVDVRGEHMQAISQEIEESVQESTAAPDSSTGETVGEISSNTATNVQQQLSTNISHSLEADATTDEQTSRSSLDNDGSSESTIKNINGMPQENKIMESSNSQGTEYKTADKVSQDTEDLESSEENGMSFASSPEGQFEQRNLQIYRYIATHGGPDIRYSPYVTRRRPLRSGYGSGENYRRFFFRGQRREARQTDDNALQTTSGGPALFGDTCSIS